MLVVVAIRRWSRGGGGVQLLPYFLALQCQCIVLAATPFCVFGDEL